MAQVRCNHCHNGYNTKQVEEKCYSCSGSGKTYGYGDPCTSCSGRGKRLVQKDEHCYSCGGKGYTNQPDKTSPKKKSQKKPPTSTKNNESVFSETGAVIGFLITFGYLMSENAEIGEAFMGGLVGGILLGWTIKLIVWGGLIYFLFQMVATG